MLDRFLAWFGLGRVRVLEAVLKAAAEAAERERVAQRIQRGRDREAYARLRDAYHREYGQHTAQRRARLDAEAALAAEKQAHAGTIRVAGVLWCELEEARGGAILEEDCADAA